MIKISIFIREYLGEPEKDKNFIQVKNEHMENINSLESFGISNSYSSGIIQKIEGIHGYPFATRNFTRYMPTALEGSTKTWTVPYERPLILNHNEYDGKIIGRIKNAEYVTTSRSGTPALVFTTHISDKEAIEQVEDGRLQTVSIGVMCHEVKCSICGADLTTQEGWDECTHAKGEIYDGKICYWDIYSMEAKELSYVIVPSDMYAGNIIDTSIGNNNFSESYKNYNKSKNNKHKGDNALDFKTIEEAVEEAERLSRLNKKYKQAKEDFEDEIDSVREKLKKAEKTSTELEESLEKEKTIVSTKELELETIKNELSDAKESVTATEEGFKNYLATLYVSIREKLGKSAVTVEEAKEKSTETLKELINEMKEEFSVKLPKDTEDPTLKTKEHKDTELEINVAESIGKLFNLD